MVAIVWQRTDRGSQGHGSRNQAGEWLP